MGYPYVGGMSVTYSWSASRQMNERVERKTGDLFLGCAFGGAVLSLFVSTLVWPSVPVSLVSTLLVGAIGLTWLRELRRAEHSTRALVDAAHQVAHGQACDRLNGPDPSGIYGAFNEMVESFERESARARKSESIVRQSVNSSPDGVIWLDESGAVIDANGTALSACGMELNQMVGKTVFDINDQITVEQWVSLWQRLSWGETCIFESEHACPAAESYPIRVIASPLDLDDRVIACATVRNISHEKRTNDAISWVISATHSTCENYFDELCKSVASALGMELAYIAELSGDDSAQVLSVWGGSGLTSGIVYKLKATPCCHTIANDQCLYTHGISGAFPEDTMLDEMNAESYIGVRLKDSKGNTLGLLAAICTQKMDDEANKVSLLRLFAARAASELERRAHVQEVVEVRDRARLLAAVAENTENTVFIMDERFRVYWVNPAFTKATGYTQDEVSGLTPFEIFGGPETDLEKYEELVEKLKRQERIEEVVRVHKKSGEPYWAEVRASPTYDENGVFTGYISIERDITQQLDQQHKIAMAQASAEDASRAKSEFLANMSHEIRTPMTAILGFAEILDRDEDLDQAIAREAVGIIRRNGEHLLSVVNDILDFSKIEAGKMNAERGEVDLFTVVDQVISLMRVRADAKGLELAVRFTGPIPERIQTDPVRLRQILTNLIANAIKFTESGSVTVNLHCESDLERPLIVCDVIDTGIGMTADQQRTTLEFNAFSQTDSSPARRVGSTGLGLRISRALIDLLGGTLSLESAPGAGSTFTFTIDPGPLDGIRMVEDHKDRGASVGAPRPLRNPDSEMPRLAGVRVLLVEDGIDNQRLIRFQLERAGAEVCVAENGLVALELIGEHPAKPSTFDIVLMDMQMPEMDGYDATRELRRRGHTIPVIAVTAHAMDGERGRCLEVGCSDYISKPVNRELLIARCAAFAKQDRAAA